MMASPVEPGGFDYQFIPPLHDDLECAICHLAFKDPVQTLCGHRFCRECLAEFHRRSRRICPMDNQELAVEEIFPDNATKRKVFSSPVMCPNTRSGCEWIEELSQVDNHRKVCLFEEVTCTARECSVRVIRNKLSDHVTTTCLWRNYECDQCRESLPFCTKEAHDWSCKRVPVKCPNGCNAQITMPREQLHFHLKKNCPLAFVPCQFEDIGCFFKIQRRYLGQHLKSCSQIHLDLACKKVGDMGQKMGKLEQEIENVQEQNRKQNEEIERVKSQNQKQSQDLESFRSHQSRPVFIGKIQNFQQLIWKGKQREQEYVDSDPFFTGEHGYKLRVRLYPNGAAEGKETHLSVYIAIMKSNYDAILEWPFRKRITFTIIDQQGSKSDRENITKCDTVHSTNEAARRPLLDQNGRFGFSSFASHEKLRTRKYVVDDTLFIQVDVTDE